MAPSKEPEVPLHAIDRTPEYEEFMDKLKAYHQERGTTLEAEPKVGPCYLDLYKTLNHIVENGGYDKVSDEKLAWRRMAEQLGIHSSNVASTAFSLKEKYYKNLAAYEIKFVHGQEPPPKDILEDVSAKGGSLLTRTRENFRGPKRESGTVGDSAAASGDDATPSRERPTPDAAPPSSVRASRGLREAPPQRVIFQPDTGPSRPTRHASGQQPPQAGTPGSASQSAGPHSPAPTIQHTPVPLPHQPRPAPRGPSSSYNPPNGEHVSTAIDSYIPRSLQPPQQQQALPMRPLDTPSNNPAEFARRRKVARSLLEPPRRSGPHPGVGFEGPNIYIRCLMALRSTIFEEQQFALYHLVKISYERHDKFKFEGFPGLSEGLVEKVLEIGSYFYDVNWKISWTSHLAAESIDTLDGNEGTDDILDRIDTLVSKDLNEHIIPAELADRMVLVNEAALTLRNMSLLRENAAHLAEFLPIKDLICIVLSLPKHEWVVELKHAMLDIAESLTPYMEIDSRHPLYNVLMWQLRDSDDRGVILTTLRALGRISMNLEAPNKLDKVPTAVLVRISELMLLNDDELMDACLDFLYQYTAVVNNVDNLVKSINCEHLVHHLVRLLSHNARRYNESTPLRPLLKPSQTDDPAAMPEDLLQDLLKLEEPERCNQWVKCFFEEDKDSFVTQIAAWQAYQNAFKTALQAAGQPLITPADFIRNSCSVYKGSKAEVWHGSGAPGEMQQKFIIHGIRCRVQPVGIDGQVFLRCLWDSASGRPNEKCGHFFGSKQTMWNHVVSIHLKWTRGKEGSFENTDDELRCQWADCTKYSKPAKMKRAEMSHHLQTHCCQIFNGIAINKALTASGPQVSETLTFQYEETASIPDEQNPAGPPQAAGIPLSAVLILRNIARNVVKTSAQEDLLKLHELGGEGGGWNERLFRTLLPRLYEILSENKILAPYIVSLLGFAEPTRES
ncbi:Chromatin structure-remodeling complex subunit rsc9 [Colletotrichum sidae]|uniref:Chromatin structure-remodeling complex subunit rsc9 n=2 Tax=Colletotrichum orbiculare species complex TaxID=2707354 RepID=A0A4R8QHZ1_9PEZI|nr:Chromatin structure-remodeling complex subunit rsc9 [Colletotrichum spinosum]TEA21089.1 Chromatin structure-remodeling complex subunit rsc9 [Colletotrichum sidae]